MADFATLVLKSDTTGLKKAESDLKSLKTTGTQTEQAVGKSTANINKGFDSVGMSAKRMAIGLISVTAAITTASRALAASQVYVKMTNSLRALGMTADQSVAALDKIADVAKRTRAPLEATAQLYQRVSIAGKDLGASSKEVLRFTENVSLALAQTGGSAASASGALLQLSQAMSGGTVRAEEFNSILEGAFPIAQAAANAIEGAAGSVGKLRNMVIAGEISSKQFFDAIISQSDELEAAFANTVPTIGQAITVMGDSFIIAAGKMDAMLGVSSAIASGILLLAENLDRIAVYAAVAATALAVTYGGAALIAAARTITLAGAFTVLRRAILATGIGAIIIGAGELVLWFSKLVKAAGGFGNAMELLGEVAAAVWQGFVDSAAAIPPALNAVWEQMKGGFLIALSGMATSFFDLMWTIATGFNQVKGLESIGGQLMGIADAANEASGSLMSAGHSAKAAAEGSFASAAATISTSFDPARAAVEKLNGVMVETAGVTGDTGESINKINTALDGTGDASKGAGKAMKDAAKEAENFADEIERLEFDADPLKKYNAELAELNKIMATGDLSSGAYEKAVADLNEEFANSNPNISKIGDAIGDFVAGGMRDFGSLLDSFKNMIKQMIATAIANPIKLALTTAFAGGGTAAAAGQLGGALGGLGGGGGMLGSIGGALGTIGSNFGAGFMTSVYGGLGGLTGAVSGGLSVGGVAGISTAIGAIAAPLLAVAAVFSFFKKKTKELDAGLKVTVDGLDTLVQTFRTIETKRFLGLSKKVSTSITAASKETSDAVTNVVEGLQASVLASADAIGIAGSTFDNFAHTLSVSTKGLSDEAAQKAIQDALLGMADAMAGMVNGLAGFAIAGEGSATTLERLAQSLAAFNGVADALGFSLKDMSIQGAAAASAFIEARGGMDAFIAKTNAYYQLFYSDQERVAKSTDNMRTALADLGLIMPATIEGFRALVEQAERMGNMDRVGSLIDLSGAFAGLLDGQSALRDTAAADLQAAFAREMEATRASFQLAIAGLQNELTGARERLASSRAIANALESALRSRIFPSIDAQRQSQDQASAYLQSLVGQGQINDVDALQAALQAVANPSADTYATLEDYRRDFDRTSNVIANLEKTAGFALSADEQAVSLLEQQIADMQSQSDQAVSLLQQQLDALLGISTSIMSLGDAISAFEAAVPTVVTGAGGGTSGLGPIEQIYQDVLGRSADAEGLAWYRNILQNGNSSIDQIRNNISASSEAANYAATGMARLPSFDGGGYTGSGSRSGGMDGSGGFMAMLHPRETVVDHTRPAPSRGNTMSDADQRELLRLLRMIERNTKDTTRGVEDLNEAAA
jgi:tape measure domain-containing protein